MANPQPDKFTTLSNELLEAIIRTDFTKRQRAILDLILRLSYGIQRCKYCIIPQQINFGICGIDKYHIKAVIDSLVAGNVIGRDGQKYWIRKDYDLWTFPKRYDKAAMDALVHDNLTYQNGNHGYQKGNRKVTKRVTGKLPKGEPEGDIRSLNHSGKAPPKESIKESIKEKEHNESGEGIMNYSKEEEADMKKAFDVWCSLKHTIHHTTLTAAFKTHLNPAIKKVGLNDLIAAFANYDEAIGREDIKWTYDLWKIDQFCLRGLDRFLPQNKPLERMRIGGKNVKGRNDGSSETTILQ